MTVSAGIRRGMLFVEFMTMHQDVRGARHKLVERDVGLVTDPVESEHQRFRQLPVHAGVLPLRLGRDDDPETHFAQWPRLNSAPTPP